MITVLVVDDSAFMRKALSIMLERDPDVRVLDTARDGQQAIEKVRALDPDVVTMDVEMPRMDGLTALRQIMDEAPRPVLMVSSLTREGAAATVEAMEAGAVGFIPKQRSRISLKITEIEQELIERIKSAARSNVRVLRRTRATSPSPREQVANRLSFRQARIIVIGVSTGGPFALQHVIPALPADLPVPVAVVQHMPPHFTRSLADRLDAKSALEVTEAENGMPVEPGRVIIAAGGRHLVFRSGTRGVIVQTPERPAETLHRPSADVMFASASERYDGRVLGLVMTGMGKDGLDGARAIKESGGRIIAQDEATSVVYGMPRAVAEADLADCILPMEELAGALAVAVGVAPASAQAAS